MRAYTRTMTDYPSPDAQYLALLKEIRDEGIFSTDRTGTGTYNIIGRTMRFDLSKGFPLLTTKKVPFKLILTELLWFIAGDTHLKTLLVENNHIWDEWPYKAYLKKNGLPIPKTNSDEWNAGMKEFTERIASDPEFEREYGDLGPVYGFQWRSWPDGNGGHIDQLANVIEQIKKSPDSRRHIVSAWNPAQINEMAIAGLPPCHCLFQFSVLDGKLHCQLYQRSCDFFLGVPFNIASYALLTMMVAQACNLEPGEFIWTGHSVHLYQNHLEQAAEQLSRSEFPSPKVIIDPSIKDIFAFRKEHFELVGYESHPAIKAPIAV